jgi:hypothetical protein
MARALPGWLKVENSLGDIAVTLYTKSGGDPCALKIICLMCPDPLPSFGPGRSQLTKIAN